MGRMSDAMGAIFLGYSTLHHFARHKDSVPGLAAVAESSLQQLEWEAQTALKEAARNFPKPLGAFGGLLLSAGVAPLGELMRPYRMPNDDLVKEVSKLVTTPSAVSAMFADNVFTATDSRVAALLKALPTVVEADKVASACKKEKREPTASETELLAKADALRDQLVQVDVHEMIGSLEEQKGYMRPALSSTERRLHGAAADFGQAQQAAASAM